MFSHLIIFDRLEGLILDHDRPCLPKIFRPWYGHFISMFSHVFTFHVFVSGMSQEKAAAGSMRSADPVARLIFAASVGSPHPVLSSRPGWSRS